MLKFIWKPHSLNELWLIDLYLDYSSRESKKNSDLFLAEKTCLKKTVKKWLKMIKTEWNCLLSSA